MTRSWHQLDAPSALRELKADPERGLSGAEAARRLATYGLNELPSGSSRSPWRIVWEQLTALLMLVLIAAAAVSLFLGDYQDAIAIGLIVILNALLGFSQEYRAEKAIAALKKFSVPSARVRRDGDVREISSNTLVPGDIVLLEAGNFVPADCRLLEAAGLKAQESALTGESEPLDKTTCAIDQAELPLGDRSNIAYLGTFVTSGRGKAVVTETGCRTELARIAILMQTVGQEVTPLQRRLNRLGKNLAAAALVLVGVIFVLGLLRGEPMKLLFLTAVSLGVAAVPEGLPAVVTIALALGSQRMLKRRALVRHLSAVETLGSVTVICSDKTGTLTENRMTASALQSADASLSLKSESVEEKVVAGFRPLVVIGALCNDAVMPSGGALENTIGDPTEAALLVAASRFGARKSDLTKQFPRVAEIPFSSDRKRMTTIHRSPPAPQAAFLEQWPSDWRYLVCTKGAIDGLLEISSAIWTRGQVEPLTRAWRERVIGDNERLTRQGMRVLAMAFRGLEFLPGNDGEIEQDLVFTGLIGLLDPPRAEVPAAVATCKNAGIRPVMITGDHGFTAQSIGERIGISSHEPPVAGPLLDHLPQCDLDSLVDSATIYARVSPEHKLKIVAALQRRGHIVAMTGDGVNDAPALKKADIGVAMGITGTDVAREAADMILLDDNFATIVRAVEEGRVIYDNIRKFIRYILTTNSAEIWVMLVAPMVGMPLPLLPLQILWMNLVTDGLPALALGMEPAETEIMQRPPIRPDESIFARGLGRHVAWVGVLMAFLCLSAGYWYWRRGDPNWQSLLFTALTLSQMAHVLAIRSERRSLFRVGLLSNKPLLGAVSLTLVLQLALLYVPFLKAVFKTHSLNPGDIILILFISSTIFCAVELEKKILQRRSVGSDPKEWTGVAENSRAAQQVPSN